MDYRFTEYFRRQVLRKRPYLRSEMNLNYYPETDSLYIDLIDRPSSESRGVSDGVVLDYDADGNLVGIDIDNTSKKLDLTELTLSKTPGRDAGERVRDHFSRGEEHQPPRLYDS